MDFRPRDVLRDASVPHQNARHSTDKPDASERSGVSIVFIQLVYKRGAND
jgi:hypothetical protein